MKMILSAYDEQIQRGGVAIATADSSQKAYFDALKVEHYDASRGVQSEKEKHVRSYD